MSGVWSARRQVLYPGTVAGAGPRRRPLNAVVKGVMPRTHGVQVVAHLRGAAALMYASRAGLLSTVAAVRIYLKDSRLTIHGPRWASTTRTRCGCGPDRRRAGSLTMSQTREPAADTHVAERAGSGNQHAAQYAPRDALTACSASCSSMLHHAAPRAGCCSGQQHGGRRTRL